MSTIQNAKKFFDFLDALDGRHGDLWYKGVRLTPLYQTSSVSTIQKTSFFLIFFNFF